MNQWMCVVVLYGKHIKKTIKEKKEGTKEKKGRRPDHVDTQCEIKSKAWKRSC